MKVAFRTSNPALSTKSFGGFAGVRIEPQQAMTIQGTVDKTAILLAIVAVTAIWPWRLFFGSGDPEIVLPWLIIGTLGGFVVALVTIFKKRWAPATTPLYAACEGLALGGISAVFEARYPGIVIQAVGAHLRHARGAAARLPLRARSARPRTSSSASSRRPAGSPSSTSSRS